MKVIQLMIVIKILILIRMTVIINVDNNDNNSYNNHTEVMLIVLAKIIIMKILIAYKKTLGNEIVAGPLREKVGLAFPQ